MIALKRVYDKATRDDGACYLVERLWPRGIRKDSLRLDAWLKDVAPSTNLRRWFGHDPQKWEEFRRRYFNELDARAARSWMLMELSEDVRAGAGRVFPVEPVCTLDALHLATALMFLQAFPDLRILTFDQRIEANCRALGIA